MARTIKLMIMTEGDVEPTYVGAERGYEGNNPVIEITGIPDEVTDEEVANAYARCVFRPVMHAEIPIAWARIEHAKPGEIVQLVGRPTKADEEKRIRLNITLSPAAVAILDERGAGRSQEIERLILESEKRQRKA